MRICLIQLQGGEFGRQDESHLSLCNMAEPLGLLCIDAYLRQNGHKVSFIHPVLEPYSRLSTTEMLRRIVEFCPEMIGFSSMTNQIPDTRRLAAMIKSALPHVINVIGGDHISAYPQDLVNFGEFDIGIVGEGEECINWVVENLRSKFTATSAPPGVYWKDKGLLLGHGRAKRLKDLNSLPYATRFFDLLKSSRVGALMWPPLHEQTGMVSIYASRGCPYNCTYCDAQEIWGNKVVWRSPHIIVQEMRNVRDRFGVNTAFFVDLTFNSDREKVFEICDVLADAKLGISWYVLLRVGNARNQIMVDRDMLETLKRAGCIKVGFGVETISPSIGQSLQRQTVNGNLFKIMKWVDEIGMLSKVFLIIGHPNETLDYYTQLEEYLEELGVDEVRISYLTPFPGTVLWKNNHGMVRSKVGYEDYTTFRSVITHPELSAVELQEIRSNILSRYYTSEYYQKRIREKIKHHPHFEESFTEFREYILSQLRIPNPNKSEEFLKVGQ